MKVDIPIIACELTDIERDGRAEYNYVVNLKLQKVVCLVYGRDLCLLVYSVV